MKSNQLTKEREQAWNDHTGVQNISGKPWWWDYETVKRLEKEGKNPLEESPSLKVEDIKVGRVITAPCSTFRWVICEDLGGGKFKVIKERFWKRNNF